MDVDTLLLVTTYRPNDADQRRNEHSEFNQLLASSKALPDLPLPDPAVDYGVIAKTTRFIFSLHFLDVATGTLTPFGSKFLVESAVFMDDFRLIFQYLSDPLPERYSVAGLAVPLNPFRYARFCASVVESVSCIPESPDGTRGVLSALCRVILFRAPRFCRVGTFRELRAKLLRALGFTKNIDERQSSTPSSRSHSRPRCAPSASCPRATSPSGSCGGGFGCLLASPGRPGRASTPSGMRSRM
jgi:hypothetical protein